MHSINLSYRGIGGDDGAVEFKPEGQTLAVAAVTNAATVKLAAKIAMFGKHAADELAPLAEVKMDFLFRGKNYALTRLYQTEEGEETETFVLTETFEQTEVSYEKEAGEALLKDAFGSLAFFRMSEITEVTPERAAAALKLDEDALQQLADAKDALDADVAACSAELEQLRTSLSDAEGRDPSLAEEKSQIVAALRKETDKQNMANAAFEAAEQLKVFESKADGKEMQATLKRDAVARQAVEVSGKIAAEKQAIAKLQAQQGQAAVGTTDLQKKVDGGSRAEKDLEAEFLYKNERLKGLQNKFVETVTLAEKENSDLRRALQGHFQKGDAQIAELSAKKKRLDHEYEALLLSITGLEDKKKRLAHPMSYKKAVIDGTVCEHRIEQLTAEIEDGNRRSGELQLEIAAKNEDIRALTADVARLQAKKQDLFRQLTEGKYATKEEALNADEVYKLRLYNAHVMAETLAAEIAALNEKTSALTKRNIENDEKRKQLEDAKAELEIYLVKLKARLGGLEQQHTEKVAANLFSDAASKLEYGQRCPVCDGYVVKRNAATAANLSTLVQQMDEVKNEIASGTQKLQNILLKLGAYLSTTASGDAYLAALNNTATKKTALLKRLLSEGGAATRDEMKKALEAAADRSRKKHALNVELLETDAKLQTAAQNKMLLETSIQTLSGRESARIKQNVERAQVSLEAVLQEYRKLMPVFAGKSAKELLSGSLVDEIELETVEMDLVSQTKNFREITVQKIETDRMLILLKNKLVTSVADDAETFEDVLLKVLSCQAKELSAEMKTAEAELEDVKIRLAAVRRVTQRAEVENGSRQATVKGQLDEVKAAEQRIAQLAEQLQVLLTDLGVATITDAEKLILSDKKRAELEKAVQAYLTELTRLQTQVKEAEATPVTLEFINVDALNARLQEIEEMEAVGAARLLELTDSLAVQTERQAELEEKQAEYAARDVFKGQTPSIDALFKALIESANEVLAGQQSKLKLMPPDAATQPIIVARASKRVQADTLSEAETLAVSLAYFAAQSAVQAKLLGEYALPVVAVSELADKEVSELVQFVSQSMPMLVAAEGQSAALFEAAGA